MLILTVLIVLIAAGILMWIVDKYIPLEYRIIRGLLKYAIFLSVIGWLIYALGLVKYIKDVEI